MNLPVQAAPIDRANRALSAGKAAVGMQLHAMPDPCDVICPLLPPPANMICKALCPIVGAQVFR